jgi:hypothetical protein
MLKFEKNGKKFMEMTDNGEVSVFEKTLLGAGELKEDKEKEDEDESGNK